MSGLKGERILVSLGFSSKPVNSRSRVDLDHAESIGLSGSIGMVANGYIGAGLLVLLAA